ncbi:Signal transducing adapter molecule 1 [Sarcoptes scabiei]|nr:Signal transducing adapter molecule 1 [Sarcoptes scabiei]
MINILNSINNKSTFDPLVDWEQILAINDRVAVEQNGPKECMRSIINRLYSDIPWVIMQTLTLLDSLVSNCGKRFHLEVCSRDFENELLRLIRGDKSVNPKVSETTKLLLKKWAQSKDFKKDPQLNLIPSLYERLKNEGVSFHSSEPSKKKSYQDDPALKNPDYVSSAEEEANLFKAIELSIQEAKKKGIKTDSVSSTSVTGSSSSSATNHHSTSQSNSLYPSFNLNEIDSTKANSSRSNRDENGNKEPMKVRALYDFEAAEDNELTFKAGEIILVWDSSDANWWKGSNHRGDGLFPANFVSTDLNAKDDISNDSIENRKVQFNDEVKIVKLDKDKIKPEDVIVDEDKIDQLMSMLQEADPKSFGDPDELIKLEEHCLAMMPLIDQQMEEIDKKHALMTSLNQQLNSALNLYHELMRESILIEQMNSMKLNQQPNVPINSYQQSNQHQPHMIGSTSAFTGQYLNESQQNLQSVQQQQLPQAILNTPQQSQTVSNYYTQQQQQQIYAPETTVYQSPMHQPNSSSYGLYDPSLQIQSQPSVITPGQAPMVEPVANQTLHQPSMTSALSETSGPAAAVPNLL